MKNKNGFKIFKTIMMCLIIVYIGLYIANESGYYESRLRDRTRLTNESIERFEKDIAEGKNVKVEDYLVKEQKDYSNKASKIGLIVSKETEKVMTEGLSGFLKILGKLFG